MKKCPNCEKDFEPNSGKQKFCSDKCKVAYARKIAKGIEGVKTANEIPPPTTNVFDEEKINKQLERLSILEGIEEYCNKEGILPSDLIDAHKNRNKTAKGLKSSKNEDNSWMDEVSKNYVSNAEKLGLSKPSGYNPFDNPTFKAKMVSKTK